MFQCLELSCKIDGHMESSLSQGTFDFNVLKNLNFRAHILMTVFNWRWRRNSWTATDPSFKLPSHRIRQWLRPNRSLGQEARAYSYLLRAFFLPKHQFQAKIGACHVSCRKCVPVIFFQIKLCMDRAKLQPVWCSGL